MGNTDIDTIIKQFHIKKRRALGKAVSIVEDNLPGKEELLEYAYKTMNEECFVLGITGPGGVGKSTLISSLITYYRKINKSVGVIAVDPSSPFTGGAVLGDRVRMNIHNQDSGVFIRSLGSRGCLGGISQAAKEALYLYKSYGFDVIIVESLGVGQAETDITNFVDVTTVVLVPGYGDSIQMSKAGIQEIADIFVINKADRLDAELTYNQLINSFTCMPDEKKPIVVKAIAQKNIGIEELAESIKMIALNEIQRKEEKRKTRVLIEIKSSIQEIVNKSLEFEIEKAKKYVLEGKITPFKASKLIIENMQTNLENCQFII